MISEIGDLRWRTRVTVEGTVEVIRLQTSAHITALLEIIITDGTGSVCALFTGYRSIGGMALGTRVRLHGLIIEEQGRLAFFNPEYTLLPAAGH
jgi:hypothetical protein